MFKEVNIAELAVRYKKSKSYLSTILSRPEFNKFSLVVSNKKGKFVFNDCNSFNDKLIFLINK